MSRESILGERCCTAKLTNSQALIILQSKGIVSSRELAHRYGISRWQVYSIWSRRQWKHLNPKMEN